MSEMSRPVIGCTKTEHVARIRALYTAQGRLDFAGNSNVGIVSIPQDRCFCGPLELCVGIVSARRERAILDPLFAIGAAPRVDLESRRRRVCESLSRGGG